MQIIYADYSVPKNITKSIFLAGPSPRTKNINDWRHEAISYLQSIHFDGTVFIPVPEKRFFGEDDSATWTYDNQVQWECQCRHVSDLIVFWVPRDIMGGMPAFTTNIEFGEDLYSGKIVYGRPDNAEKCRYLDKRIQELGQPVYTTLEDTLLSAVQSLGDGSYRENGEVYVPLFIWNTPQFKSWYANLKLVGNRLDEAKLLHHVKFSNKHVFCYTLWVKVWVTSETRFKQNEFVFSRTDISSVVAFYKDANDIKIVLVKEFRSPVNNQAGFVYELPGGSATLPDCDPKENAQHELEEEVGLTIEDLTRFQYVGQRQLAATLSSHQSQVYRIELNTQEYLKIVEDVANKKSYGLATDSEITYVEIVSIHELKNSFVDFSTLGMIYQAIYMQ